MRLEVAGAVLAVEELLLVLLLVLFAFAKFQRLPFRPAVGFHASPGTNMIEAIFGPLIVAMPHSVSTVTSLTSVAPVIESPLSITTVVEASSADANLMPATSERGMLAVPNEVRISSVVVSVSVPESLVVLSRSIPTLKGRTLAEDAIARATGLALAISLEAFSWASALEAKDMAAIAAAATNARSENTDFIERISEVGNIGANTWILDVWRIHNR